MTRLPRPNPAAFTAEDWAARVEAHAARWEVATSEISMDDWRKATIAAGQRFGGIGTPEWRKRCRKATRRAMLRHPWRAVVGLISRCRT